MRKKSRSILRNDKNGRNRFNSLYNLDKKTEDFFDYKFENFSIKHEKDYSEFDVEKCQKDLNKQKQEILNKVKQQKQYRR